MLDADAQLHPFLRRRSTYRHATCSKKICNMRRVTRVMQHGTRKRGSATKPKQIFILRAVGAGGKRSTIEFERSEPNARMREMSTSATTGVSWIRAMARAGGRRGTHLGLRRTELVGLQRHAGLTAERARSQTRSASRATCVSATCAAPPSLCAAMRHVRTWPSAIRWQQQIARSAPCRPCRGCVSVRRRTRHRHAVPRECRRGECGVQGGSGGGKGRACGRSARVRRR
jgi:hypothetical protein